jgi:hypothetical protein
MLNNTMNKAEFDIILRNSIQSDNEIFLLAIENNYFLILQPLLENKNITVLNEGLKRSISNNHFRCFDIVINFMFSKGIFPTRDIIKDIIDSRSYEFSNAVLRILVQSNL